MAGFVDATGGGGWGPVGTPAILASGRMEPRKVIGSIDTSEFFVAVAASLGFFVGLGTAGIDTQWVVALLLGGLIAAPIAAYLVRIVPPRVLGSAVGGLIVLTNTRTLLLAFDVADVWVSTALWAIAAVWAAAVAWSINAHLVQRREAAAEAAVVEGPAEPTTPAATGAARH